MGCRITKGVTKRCVARLCLTVEKAQIAALIKKHRPHTPETPDEVNTSGTGKNAKVDG